MISPEVILQALVSFFVGAFGVVTTQKLTAWRLKALENRVTHTESRVETLQKKTAGLEAIINRR